jgi:hypothetical protein
MTNKRVLARSNLFFCVLVKLRLEQSEGFSLITTSTISGVSKDELFDFIATPANWPSIVASSHSVKKPSDQFNDINQALDVGDKVEEIFGLPPILPLSVVKDERNGDLKFYSKTGVPNFAKNCWMNFSFSELDALSAGPVKTKVQLVMEYEALNPLITAATPVLNIDNALALKVLLPLALKRR